MGRNGMPQLHLPPAPSSILRQYIGGRHPAQQIDLGRTRQYRNQAAMSSYYEQHEPDQKMMPRTGSLMGSKHVFSLIGEPLAPCSSDWWEIDFCLWEDSDFGIHQACVAANSEPYGPARCMEMNSWGSKAG